MHCTPPPGAVYLQIVLFVLCIMVMKKVQSLRIANNVRSMGGGHAWREAEMQNSGTVARDQAPGRHTGRFEPVQCVSKFFRTD